MYPGTTHAWDRAELHNAAKKVRDGEQVTYFYSKDVTADSGRRMFEFLDTAMPARP